jgi:RNA polymerase sigma-70 factor, ECF subfamily
MSMSCWIDKQGTNSVINEQFTDRVLSKAGAAEMSISNRTILQNVLVAEYEGLVRRLTRKFGSSDFASETLHETFARLESVTDRTTLQNPRDYLFRAAINVGKNLRRAERVRATAAEIEAVLDVADEAPSPAQATEARSDMDQLMTVLGELPLRTQTIFKAALFDEKPYVAIASEQGVSLRTVERDVQRAMEHCARHLGHFRAPRKI